MSGGRKRLVCVASGDRFIRQAALMAGSFLAHNGGWEAVCYADGGAKLPWWMERRSLPALLGGHAAFRGFTPFEQCEAGRFLAAAECLGECGEVLYCDNDLRWYGQYKCPPDGELLLTPHFLTPKVIHGNRQALQRDGYPNIGLMHFRGKGGIGLCEDIIRRVEAEPGGNRRKGVLWLQPLLNPAPWLGPEFRTVADPGCNVGNWNLRKGDRKVVTDGESGQFQVECGGALHPLTSFHFSRRSFGKLLDGRFGEAVKSLAKAYLAELRRNVDSRA